MMVTASAVCRDTKASETVRGSKQQAIGEKQQTAGCLGGLQRRWVQ